LGPAIGWSAISGKQKAGPEVRLTTEPSDSGFSFSRPVSGATFAFSADIQVRYLSHFTRGTSTQVLQPGHFARAG